MDFYVLSLLTCPLSSRCHKNGVLDFTYDLSFVVAVLYGIVRDVHMVVAICGKLLDGRLKGRTITFIAIIEERTIHGVLKRDQVQPACALIFHAVAFSGSPCAQKRK